MLATNTQARRSIAAPYDAAFGPIGDAVEHDSVRLGQILAPPRAASGRHRHRRAGSRRTSPPLGIRRDGRRDRALARSGALSAIISRICASRACAACAGAKKLAVAPSAAAGGDVLMRRHPAAARRRPVADVNGPAILEADGPVFRFVAGANAERRARDRPRRPSGRFRRRRALRRFRATWRRDELARAQGRTSPPSAGCTESTVAGRQTGKRRAKGYRELSRSRAPAP